MITLNGSIIVCQGRYAFIPRLVFIPVEPVSVMQGPALNLGFARY
jgi:hypothetical protein